MRNVPLGQVDHLPAEVLPIATDYPPDTLLAWHEHRRAQLLYAATGTMLVETDDGAWTVPGERAVLIPPRTRHQVRMLDTRTASLYVEPSAVPWWPAACRVVAVPPLLRELLLAAADLEADYAGDARDSALIALVLLETAALSEVPLYVALPHEEPFSALCRGYLADPGLSVSNTDWARATAMSERMLTRRFRQATGTSPAAWRSRARLLASIPLLRHKSVTEVAVLLGYASPAAFSYAFTRAFDVPPSSMRQH
ncbi:AraC-like DNA-binding protein [Streptomyces sp. 3211.6]|uniref:AraC family transcriptional regulator n=1 Tax=Streptomyces TaxID=1883 RepID=UPI0009A4EE52|nr:MULTISPECIES: helix-turn-helix transcriptional regulator [Streptomyces]RKT08010.1 AraC-like DNA-binding protein [Streptomyces sp. 3211.6]RPF44371.1 AraC-like DNA-binding protein [Streptomyces sp. Ag109_G2-6]